MEVRVRMNYRDRLLETQFDATIRPADDRVLRGGQLAGELTVTGPERDMPPLETAMTGEIRITDLLVMAPVVAGEPIGPLSLRYAFGARLDPLAQPPDPASLDPLSRASELTNAASVIQAAAGEIPAFQGVLQITDGDLLVNGVETEFLPTLWGIYRRRSSVPAAPALLAAPAWIAVEGVVGPTSTQTLLEAIPTAIAGQLADAQVRGELSATVRYRLPLFAIVAMDWVAETELDGFAVTRIPAAMNPYKLNGEFLHTIVDPEVDFQRTVVIPERRPASMTWMLTHSEHTERQIRQMRSEDAAAGGSPPDVVRVTGTPPEPDPTYRYVYLDQMSRWIPAAVLTAEDGDFFFYGGVNPITLKAAIARNLEAGEVLYGASTISMQVAKMLFLDQERIFARKLQEVFLVYLMEHHVVVPKDRILELYLNLAEFGPGIFGVYDASAYYFGTHPREISAGEAAWLASILPAPKTYHRYFASGWISDGWWERMQSYLQIMLERGRISPAEFEAATEQRPVFRRP